MRPGRQRREIRAHEDRARPGRIVAAKHAGRVASSRTNGSANTSSAAIRAASRSRSKITPTPRRAPNSSSSASMTTDLPVDLVVQEGNLLAQSNRSRIRSTFEGRVFTESRRDPGHASSSGPSSCRWCCAARRGGRHEDARPSPSRLSACWFPASCHAQVDVPWRRRSRRRLPRRRAAPVPSRQMEVPDRRPDRLVARSTQDGVIYFGGDDGNVYAVNAADGRQLWKRTHRRPRAVDAGDRRRHASTSAATTASSTRSTRRPARLRWKFTHRAASGDSRRKGCTACSRRTRRSPMPSTSSCRALSSVGASVYFGSGDGNVYALDAASGALQLEIPDGRRRARLARVCRRRRVLRQLGQLLLRGRRRDAAPRNGAFTAAKIRSSTTRSASSPRPRS